MASSTNHSTENILNNNSHTAFFTNGSKHSPSNYMIHNAAGMDHNDVNGVKSASNAPDNGDASGNPSAFVNQPSNGVSSNGISHNNGSSKNSSSNENGKSFNENSNGGTNLSDCLVPRLFTSGQKDILRLIGQHLRYLGLNKTTETLIKESGCVLEHPTAVNFCNLIMNGEWDEAEIALNSLQPIMENSNTDVTNMRFLILEQKYLENLEDGKILDALKCLRDELAPLKYNIERLHELSSFLMCTDQLNLKSLSKWAGKNTTSRQTLMNKLQTFLPPDIMLPPNRLESLLDQAISYQCDKCPYHNVSKKGSIDSWSFLKDHVCSKDEFPSVCLQVLNDHSDEVIICKFSNNGKKLATGSKDGCLFVWDVDPSNYKLTLNKCYEDHSCGVCFVAWSPDDKYLIACGSEESNELWIWDIENKVLKKRINNNHDDSLTSAAWFHDGQSFVAGGVKGQFYYCDLDGNIRDTWEGIRVQALQCLPDGLVLAADKLKRIRSYNFKEISDSNLIQEDYQIMSFTLNKDHTLCLISLQNQCLHLWDIRDKCLVHRYQGTVQNHFVSHSTFGGVDENFIAGGSEDSRVYIWNKKNENAICILEGHSKAVTSVDWNPVYLGVLASASDDGHVRIWGPKCKLQEMQIDTSQNGICVSEHDRNNNLSSSNDNIHPSTMGSSNSMNNFSNNISSNNSLPHYHNLATQQFGSFNTPPPPHPPLPRFFNQRQSTDQQQRPTNTRSDRSTPV